MLFRIIWSFSLFILMGFSLVGCSQQAGTAVPDPQAGQPTPGAASGVADEVLPYQDPQLPIDDRVEDLLARMTLEEKIGQMTLVEKNSINEADITSHYIGALLSGGGGYPLPNTAANWANMVNGFQERALQTRLAIPLLYGVDAIHGHNNVRDTVIFPHNIGLGATRDAELVKRIARTTAVEVAATGIHWNYAPVLAVPQDIRWGRTYEAFSEETELVSHLATAYLQGLQGLNDTPDLSHPLTLLATPKHYVGDGGTVWDSSTTENFILDQGITGVDEVTLRTIHLPPYIDAIEAGAMSIMVSYTSWNGQKMHGQKYLLTDVLKGELAFEGFLVSDWGAIDQISPDYYRAVVTAMNAGIDMNMVPYDYNRFINNLTTAVLREDVSLERIDDAVRRILTVKFQLGLFERPFPDETLLEQVGIDEHRELAREAVSKSLVLLKNEDQTLPLSKDIPLIFVAGEAAHDIGMQSGGWTIEWQGRTGNITSGTTIVEAISHTVSENSVVEYNKFGRFEGILDASGNPAVADIGIVVVGERPYAEGHGDRNDLSLSEADLAAINRMRENSKKLIVILISGRPLIITGQLDDWDALVAAWLPGTEGQGIADVLFGDYPFSGKLSFNWPRSMDQVPLANLKADSAGPLFPFGYGLHTINN